MKIVYRLLCTLHGFVGIGAIAGGLAAIINPNNPLGVTVEVIENSPFNNFLIPGIILFSIIGIGNIISAILAVSDFRFRGYISSIFSWALVIWIIVQCIMMNEIIFLHILFFVIGLVEVILSGIILFEQGLFPANYILNILKKDQYSI